MNFKHWFTFSFSASLFLAACYLAFVGPQVSSATPQVVGHKLSPSQEKERKKWVAKCLKDIESVKVGMTRKDLGKVLEWEAGLHGPGHGRYIHPECGYFKVDIEFEYTKDKGEQGYWKPTDKITKVSKPFLGWEIIG